MNMLCLTHNTTINDVIINNDKIIIIISGSGTVFMITIHITHPNINFGDLDRHICWEDQNTIF